jgi:hypothetical protein
VGYHVTGDFEQGQITATVGAAQAMGAQLGGQRGRELAVEVSVEKLSGVFAIHWIFDSSTL